MSINAVGSTNGTDQLVQQLMKGIDTNHDNQVSTSEFTTFLTNLLAGFTSRPTTTSSPVAREGSTSAPIRVAAPLAAGSYVPMRGFDTAKINDPSHNTLKYQFARAVQDLGLLNAPTTGNLQSVVDRLNQNGGRATVVGKDTIDFGDGYGPHDVIFSVDDPSAAWQF